MSVESNGEVEARLLIAVEGDDEAVARALIAAVEGDDEEEARVPIAALEGDDEEEKASVPIVAERSAAAILVWPRLVPLLSHDDPLDNALLSSSGITAHDAQKATSAKASMRCPQAAQSREALIPRKNGWELD